MRILPLCFIMVSVGCHTPNVQLASANTDSTSVQDNSATTSEYPGPVINITNAPAWLLEYIKVPIDTNEFFHETYVSIDDYKNLNDSVDVVMYNTDDGVCLRTYVATFIKSKPKDACCIQTQCDIDAASPVYKYTEYVTTNNLLFHILEITDSPLYDTVLTSNGDFIEGINFDNTEITSDTIAYDVKILSTGVIAGKRE